MKIMKFFICIIMATLLRFSSKKEKVRTKRDFFFQTKNEQKNLPLRRLTENGTFIVIIIKVTQYIYFYDEVCNCIYV